MNVLRLPFEDCWTFQGQRIFLDYLRGEASVAPFYPSAPPRDGRIGARGLVEACAKQLERLKGRAYPRAELRERLEGYHRWLGASPAALRNVAALGEEGTWAVVTGQQAMISGGPLLVLYKAMSAVAAARAIESAGLGRCVPVFWNASDDHDVGEADHVWLLEGADVRRHALALDGGGRPVSDISLDASVAEYLRGLDAALPVSAACERAQALFRRNTTGTLSLAFSLLLGRLFAEEGLVLVEPRVLRGPAASIMARAVTGHAELAAALAKTTAAMRAAGYRPPLDEQDHLHLFCHQDSRRRRILPEAGGLRIEGEEGIRGVEELASRVLRDPHAFSPNVALRPLVQDALFPTVCYVGGPTELAYLGQLSGLYGHFGIPMPVVQPRLSATLLDPKSARTAERLGLDWAGLFAREPDPAALQRTVPAEGLEAALDGAASDIDTRLDALRRDLAGFSPRLPAAVDRPARRISGELAKLREQALKSWLDEQGAGGRQVRRLISLVFPLGKPQERVLASIWWFALYGPELLGELSSALDPLTARHQVVFLPEPEKR